jgi:hypothetical protein
MKKHELVARVQALEFLMNTLALDVAGRAPEAARHVAGLLRSRAQSQPQAQPWLHWADVLEGRYDEPPGKTGAPPAQTAKRRQA